MKKLLWLLAPEQDKSISIFIVDRNQMAKSKFYTLQTKGSLKTFWKVILLEEPLKIPPET